MNYVLEIDINCPRDKLVKLFDDPDTMPRWQPDLISFEHKRGVAGQVGAESVLRYKRGKREFEMVETITSRNLPEEFSGTYETNGVKNKLGNRFILVDDKTTKWQLDSEFKFSGLLKLIAFLRPSIFKKQTFKYMEQFKQFAERA